MELIACEYGVSKTFDLPLIEYGATDYKIEVTLAVGDVKISKDNGTFTNITTLPTINGAWMEITLSATEMQASRIKVQIIDQTATKVFEDTGGTLSTNIQETLSDMQEATLTRLASSVYGSTICSSSVTVTDGTITSGDVNDCCTINQQYLKVQETGKFKIDFDFTSLSSNETEINVVYRYFGPGSTNHKVECLMWNYTTSQWDDMLATDKDFPSSDEDRLATIHVSGTVSDYFTGSSPNIAAKVRIYHISNFNTNHYFWVDFITLGELEQIYVAPDNAGISSINDVVGKDLLQHTTIDTLASQTVFTLLEASADENTYNNATIIITDSADSEQKTVATVLSYEGSTKQITLESDPGIFTMAIGDTIDILANSSTASLINAVISEKVDTLLDINKSQDLVVNTTTRLEYQWKDSDGEPVNISALTFKFKAVKNAGESSPAITEVTGTISDGPNGRWYFDILPTTVFKGHYEIWAVDGASKITPLTNAGGARIETHPRL